MSGGRGVRSLSPSRREGGYSRSTEVSPVGDGYRSVAKSASERRAHELSPPEHKHDALSGLLSSQGAPRGRTENGNSAREPDGCCPTPPSLPPQSPSETYVFIRPYTLRPTPYTLRPTPYTLHPTPHTLHPTPYASHPTTYSRHPTPHTLHPKPYTLHPTPYTLHPPYTIHPTP